MKTRTLLTSVLVLAVTAGCNPAREPSAAWEPIDLWRQAPESGALSSVRDDYRSLRGRALRAVTVPAGRAHVWRLELGDEPSFSFRPLPDDAGCVYVVEIDDGERRVEVLRRAFARAEEHPAASVEIALAELAGRPVRLSLGIEDAGEGSCRSGRWGSPVVLGRKPLAAGPRRERPNILLLGLDTLRADALGVYGREPSVSPAIDRLAAESDLFLEAFSSTNNTNPSFASLMTGLWAKNHGVYDLVTPLPDEHRTLAELLQEAGYATAAVLAVRHLGKNSGLRQGFDAFLTTGGQLYAETVVQTALDGLPKLEEPFFLWLHFFDPHVPHTPPSPYHLGFAPMRLAGPGPVEAWVPFRPPGSVGFQSSGRGLPGNVDLYPAEVAYLDREIDRLLEVLRSRGLLERTVVALVADHGETLGERGRYFDHDGLHDDTTPVPLMIRGPDARSGRRIEGLVQHFDLFPTLLRAAGVEPPASDAVDLYDLADDGGRRAVFSEGAMKQARMVRTSDFKYFARRKIRKGGGHHPVETFLYDLRRDPGELDNLAGRGHPAEERLAALVERWAERLRGDLAAPEALAIDDEEKAQLEALGYLQ